MKRKKLWFWLMTVTSVIYILWRLFFTLPLHAGIVSLIAGIALFAAEFISMLEAVIHYICMSKDKAPEFPVVPEFGVSPCRRIDRHPQRRTGAAV